MRGVLRQLGAARPTGLQRLDLASWTKVDPNGREGAPPVDNGDGNGVTITLTGGWSTTDIFDGPTYYDPQPLRDRLGRKIGGGEDWVRVWHEMAERTAPPLTSDIMVVYGLCDRVPGSGSENAVAEGLVYAGSSRACRRAKVAAGTGSLLAAGGSSTSLRYFQSLITTNGEGATRQLCTITAASGAWTQGLDSSRATTAFGSGTAGNGAVTVNNSVSSWYRFVSLIRVSATDATTRTLAVDWYDDTGLRGALET